VPTLDLELFRQLLEDSPDGMSVMDAERRYLYINPAAAQLFGRRREELIGQDALLQYPESAHDEIRRRVAMVLEGQPLRRTSIIVRPDGEQREIDTLRIPLRSRGEPLVASIFRDVTDVRRREREASTLAGTAATVASMGSLKATLDTLAAAIVHATRAVAAVVLSGDPAGSLSSAGTAGLHPDYMAKMDEAFAAGATPPSMGVLGSEPVVLHDIRGRLLADPAFAPAHAILEQAQWSTGMYLPLIFGGERVGTAVALYAPGSESLDEQRFLVTIANQAAIAVGNARLLAEAQARAAAEERQHLARELHDSVSQALYAIGLGARTARSLVATDPAGTTEAIDYVLALAEAGLAEMRALIFELRPELLAEEGLVTALRKQLDVARARHGLDVTDDLGDEPAISADAQAALYRIGQEAMNNVVKHARAKHVTVRLTEREGRATLEVIDDGSGFGPERETGHLGLTSMRERAAAQGGEVSIISAPGGTHVSATVPSSAGN
jgi:PAS domain S-box-containing protein